MRDCLLTLIFIFNTSCGRPAQAAAASCKRDGGLPMRRLKRLVFRTRLHLATLAWGLAAAVTVGATHGAEAASCGLGEGDFCVCCPPNDCRREAAYCPGGVAGLLLLKAEHPECAVNVYDAARCRSGGVIASEMRSAVGVYMQGQSVRIDLSPAQLDDLRKQLSALGPAGER